MGVGKVLNVNDFIQRAERAIANGIATLDSSAKVPKNQISLTASDVGAVGTEVDPTVPALAKTLSTNNAVLAAINAATGTIDGAKIPAQTWVSVTGKPTDLAGFGITDAQPLGNELTAIQALADTPGFLKKTGDGIYSIDSSSFLPVVGGVATISSSQQFTGFVLSNGISTVAQVIGIGATNDIGAIVLRSAESANVLLTASGNSYINGGNLGIGTPSPSSPLDVNGLAKISTLNITATTPSTSPTTGASVIAGGQGIGGDCYVNGRVYERDTQTFLISTAINLTANNYINVGTVGVSVNEKELVYLVYVYLQFDGFAYNQAQGSTILSCIPWKSDFGSQSPQTFRMEGHAIDDFTGSILLSRNNQLRSINLSFDVGITTVLPGFLRVKIKELSY